MPRSFGFTKYTSRVTVCCKIKILFIFPNGIWGRQVQYISFNSKSLLSFLPLLTSSKVSKCCSYQLENKNDLYDVDFSQVTFLLGLSRPTVHHPFLPPLDSIDHWVNRRQSWPNVFRRWKMTNEERSNKRKDRRKNEENDERSTALNWIRKKWVFDEKLDGVWIHCFVFLIGRSESAKRWM